MTDTTISDAVTWPQDDGTGIPDGSEDYDSAGYFGLIAQNLEGAHVGNGLAFANVDTTNEEVDVTAGHAYILDSGTSVQSGSGLAYDTTLPSDIVYAVVLPTDVTNLGLGADTDNDVWLATDPTANDSVYIRHGSGLSAPTDPSIKLGTVNTSTGATTRASDFARPRLGTYTDVLASRSNNTQETNTSNYTRVVKVITGSITFDSINGGTGEVRIEGYIDGVRVSETGVSFYDEDGDDLLNGVETGPVTATLHVPPGSTYKVIASRATDGAANASGNLLESWVEADKA